MMDGIATSLIPLTTRCNFRLHPVVTQQERQSARQSQARAKCWIFLLCRNAPGEISVTAARRWAADLGSAG